MTVGFELQRLTGLRLFHNHMAVDLALRFFDFGTPPFGRLVRDIRRRVFEEVAHSTLPGLIFTYVWALDDPQDRAFIDDATSVFTASGDGVCFVELEATQAERLRRNDTALRLAEKYPKRDLARSRSLLLDADARYQLNSQSDFFYPELHLKVENTTLEPTEVASRIIERFGLVTVAAG
jgi:hypothetical protein